MASKEENTIKYYEKAKVEREEAIKRCGNPGCYICSRAKQDITFCDNKIKELDVLEKEGEQ